MESIIGIIQAFKEDHPHIIITDDMIKDVIECYIEELIKDIREDI